MVQATGAPIAEYFAALDDPRIPSIPSGDKLLDIVTIALCDTICGADSWVDQRCSATGVVVQVRSCPTVSLPMIPSAKSSPDWTHRAVSTLFHGTCAPTTVPWPKSKAKATVVATWHRRQDGTALPRPYPGQKGHSHGHRVGLVPWLGAGPEQGGREVQ